ncbi:MAG: RnfABCDGE type electron transport complex subunit C [Candidatus Izemoplasmatales bacterium]|jgi:electron transport complex protein RnfC|nr:RnfABCDGE type electron transport complex subunit C [Candidatus Izemoplasmatales bacterium]
MILHKAKGTRIEGKKSMSKALPLHEYLNPPFVFIPLLQQATPLKRIVEIGDKVAIGQVVALREGFGAMPIHASVSGTVTAIKKVWHASGRMVEAIEIQNDNQNRMDESIRVQTDISLLSRNDLIAKMQQAGLSGLGGAGFPTYIKYQTKCPIDVVIINAVECEPYITCDFMLINAYPEKLLKGLSYLMRAADAKKGVIAFKTYNTDIKKNLEPLLVNYPGIELYEVKDIYPAGWEKYIVQKITKKTYAGLPAEAGAIVDNSATAIVFADVVAENIPLISRVITISGEGIKNPQNFFVPLGTPVKELIQLAGGYVESLNPMKAWYIAGGPMTGRAILIDELVVNDTLGSVIVKPMPDEKHHPACLGCGKCADACPVYLTPTEIQRALESKDSQAIKELNAQKCMQCGLCSYVCPSHIEISDYVAKAKELLRKGA